MLFQIWAGFFKICFLAKSKHALFASCGEPSVFALDSILLIIDFDSDTSTSWRVFFTWLDIVKGFFFPMERSSDHLPLLSSVDVHAFLYCYVYVTSAFFFVRMYQTVDLAIPNVPAISLDLF